MSRPRVPWLRVFDVPSLIATTGAAAVTRSIPAMSSATIRLMVPSSGDDPAAVAAERRNNPQRSR
jgi:hypothetical protein